MANGHGGARKRPTVKQAQRVREYEILKKSAKADKYITQHELRDLIDGKAILEDLGRIANDFNILDKRIRTAKNTKNDAYIIQNTIHQCQARANILKYQAELKLKVLNKILPDLRAVEVKTDTDPRDIPQITDAELFELIKKQVSSSEIKQKYPAVAELMDELKDVEIIH